MNVLCPDEFSQRDIEGSMSYEELSNASYRLRFNCAMPDELVEWVVMHELMEAMTAPYADFCTLIMHEAKGSRSARKALQLRHAEIRDEMIEWMLNIIAPNKRPPVTSKI